GRWSSSSLVGIGSANPFSQSSPELPEELALRSRQPPLPQSLAASAGCAQPHRSSALRRLPPAASTSAAARSAGTRQRSMTTATLTSPRSEEHTSELQSLTNLVCR